jgi:AraC-like DNA-binding protein
MTMLDPSLVQTRLELREFSIRLLTMWIAKLDRDRIRLHLPRRRGLMRLMPNMPFHLHPELFLQISGCTTFEFPEESCHVKPGEVCLVSRGLPHRERIRPWQGPFYNIVIAYSPERTTLHLAEQNPQGKPKIVTSLELPQSDPMPLAQLLENLAEWFHADDPAGHYAVKGALLTNLTLVLTAVKRGQTDFQVPIKVMQTRQLVVQELSNPSLSVAWIGRTLQCSPDYLSRLFRKATGISLAASITKQRMIRARDLLASSTLNISEISQATGYRDPSYFTRIFRQETGSAPGVYRRRVLA